MNSRSKDSLYDTAAALRLVDSTLEDMAGIAPSPAPDASPAGERHSLAQLTDRLEQGYAELLQAISVLRQTRSVMERSTVERFSQTTDKLQEVSAATEVAAAGILDGIDKAIGIVDQLDAADGDAADARGRDLRQALRDQLFEVMGHMQFQDITSQQLAFASAVMSEMEARLSALVKLLDPVGDAPAAPLPAGAFDPHATTQRREQRQALADALIAATEKK